MVTTKGVRLIIDGIEVMPGELIMARQSSNDVWELSEFQYCDDGWVYTSSNCYLPCNVSMLDKEKYLSSYVARS